MLCYAPHSEACGVRSLGETRNVTVLVANGVLVRRLGCCGETAAWSGALSHPSYDPCSAQCLSGLSRKVTSASQLRSAASNLPMMRFLPPGTHLSGFRGSWDASKPICVSILHYGGLSSSRS
jgi:hypothetical protein